MATWPTAWSGPGRSTGYPRSTVPGQPGPGTCSGDGGGSRTACRSPTWSTACWTSRASGRSLGWVAYEAVERLEEEAESVRLFYVATTRARDALILSAGAGADANPASAALKLLDERFDRRTGACRAALPDGWALPVVR